MSDYVEHRFYSPLLDSEAVRISIADLYNSEYFCIVAAPSNGRFLREARERALNALMDAVDRGDEPGEVRVV